MLVVLRERGKVQGKWIKDKRKSQILDDLVPVRTATSEYKFLIGPACPAARRACPAARRACPVPDGPDKSTSRPEEDIVWRELKEKG
jgi:hypothetical protein